MMGMGREVVTWGWWRWMRRAYLTHCRAMQSHAKGPPISPDMRLMETMDASVVVGGGVYAPWISVISVIQRSRTCRGVTVMAIDSENRCEMPNNSAALPILEL